MEIKNKQSGTRRINQNPKNFEEALGFLTADNYQSIKYQSIFFERVMRLFKENNWVDIERYYYQQLKTYFKNPNIDNKKSIVSKLNTDFNFLIEQLTKHIKAVNTAILDVPRLTMDSSNGNLSEVFAPSSPFKQTIFLNFNYTETLQALGYAKEEDIIYIHGRVADLENNPIIFGYGDETDPDYQNIEDSGENIYLEHIKSFGYFRTENYHKLLSHIDSAPYSVSIVGHSCGLSDRVLLNEVFEHQNCQKIEVFYHVGNDGNDNFKEITQEISRHFKPQNKNVMRRKVIDKSSKNTIPQNR
jgi:hypothetical protein